jgi:hypothetical protein
VTEFASLRAFVRQRITIQENGCWSWLLAKDRDGYGAANWKRKRIPAHRLSYLAHREDLPPELDHTCRQRSCVNPDHLEAVSHAENMRRAKLTGRARQTHCASGHEFTSDNTITSKNARRCRTCLHEIQARYRQRRRAQTENLTHPDSIQ